MKFIVINYKEFKKKRKKKKKKGIKLKKNTTCM